MQITLPNLYKHQEEQKERDLRVEVMGIDDKIRDQVRKYNGDRHPSQCVGGEFLSWILAKPDEAKLKLYRRGVKRANKTRRLERYVETMD